MLLDQEEMIDMKLPHCSYITQHAHEEIHATTGQIVPYEYDPNKLATYSLLAQLH